MADADYVTILETVNRHKFLVAVMKAQPNEEYAQGRMSQPLPRQAAQALARSWAETLKVEIR